MKRFYCTICKTVKRVRQYPALIQFSPEVPPTNPTDRIGTCDSHFKGSNKIPYGKPVSFAEARRISSQLASKGR